MAGTWTHLTPELEKYVRDEIGTKGLELYQQAGRGCWVFPRSDKITFVPVANVGQVYGPNQPEETASLLWMIAQYNPERQVVAVVSLQKRQQIICIVNLS